MSSILRNEALRPAIQWALVAVLLAAAPFVLELLAWLLGDLPDEARWFADRNHGPWREDGAGLVVIAAYCGLPVIAVGSLAHGLVAAIRGRRVRVVLPFLAASALSLVLLALALSKLFWLID